MDENKSPDLNGQNTEANSAESSEPNDYEPQPRTQPLENQQNVPKKFHKLVLFLFLILMFLIAGGAAAYLMSQEEETQPINTSQNNESSNEQTEETTEEVAKSNEFESTLYPDLSFTVPEGWEVSEPETYDEDSVGEGSVDGIITVTNGDATLNLELVTVRATGFEGYSCYEKDGLTAVGDIYRFVDSDGKIVYEAGISEADAEWAEVIADEGEFTFFEDPEPNYCVLFPFIGTYSSTLTQADFPDYPYGFTEKEKAIVWLSATLEGTPTEQQQQEADEIIKSLSQPDLNI